MIRDEKMVVTYDLTNLTISKLLTIRHALNKYMEIIESDIAICNDDDELILTALKEGKERCREIINSINQIV